MKASRGSYRREHCSLDVSDLFRVRFYTHMSTRGGALSSFIDKIKGYAGEFIDGDESLKLRYKDVLIIIDKGVLVNVFKLKSK